MCHVPVYGGRGRKARVGRVEDGGGAGCGGRGEGPKFWRVMMWSTTRSVVQPVEDLALFPGGLSFPVVSYTRGSLPRVAPGRPRLVEETPVHVVSELY